MNSRSEYEPVTDKVLEGRLAKEQRRVDEQGVEPTPRLVNPLRNEVCRKTLLKFPLVLKGVMVLGVGHRPTLKPTVEDFGDSAQDSPACDRRDRQLIHAASTLY